MIKHEGGFKVFFLRDKKKFPVACVVVAKVKGWGILSYAFSTHNPADKYDRRTARDYAFRRLLSTLPVPCRGTIPMAQGAKTEIIKDIALRNDTPLRTRAAALDWLEARAEEAAGEAEWARVLEETEKAALKKAQALVPATSKAKGGLRKKLTGLLKKSSS